MALTIAQRARRKFGNGYQVVADVTFDDSYPTGGESLTAKNLGLTVLDSVIVPPTSGYNFEYDYVASKLKAFDQAIANLALSHGGKDIKGSANTDSENDDQAALPTNGALVGAETAVGAGAYVFPATAHPDMGRNVCIVFRNDSGGPLNLFEGVMTFTVTGTWRGAAQTETITFTSTAGNKAIANTKYRYKYGNKPFDTVTAVTVNNICDNAIKIAVGIGSKVGLPNDLVSPAEADVLKITKNAAHLAVTGIVDTVNMTVNLGTLADNNDFNIVYKVGGQVANAVNLSALAVRLIVMGY